MVMGCHSDSTYEIFFWLRGYEAHVWDGFFDSPMYTVNKGTG